MSFITEESGICLGHSGQARYNECGELIVESDPKYILAESNKILLLDSTCGQAESEFDCNFPRKVVDSGKYITFTNVCTLPITVTGFTVEDPVRFSLFEYPLHKGKDLYTTGNTKDLPFTLQPNEQKRINTYFHPLESELISGNAATFNDRTGDYFNSRVDVFPGFPIKNCSDDPNSCDAYFTLSGELACEENDKDWMHNNENFITPNIQDLANIDSQSCILTTEMTTFTTPGNQVESTFSGLRDTAIVYGKALDQGGRLYDKYSDIGMAGALAGFSQICQNAINSNNHNDIDNLFGSTLNNYSYVYDDGINQYPLTVNYIPYNTGIKSFGGPMFTGMIFDVKSEDPSREAYYETVFMHSLPFGQDAQYNLMFTAHRGDYDLEDFCDG